MFSVNHLCVWVCIEFIANTGESYCRFGSFQAIQQSMYTLIFGKFYIDVYFGRDSIQAVTQSTTYCEHSAP